MKWKSVSASQFKTYALCKRKWHIERFSGLPRPPSTPAQELGTEVHRILENYLRHGASFPETVAGRIAERGKPFLPEPGTGEVEGKITLTSIDPPLIGFIDLYVDGVTPEVVDHKTLGSWKGSRTEEELGTDLQMIPYAVHALEKTGAASVRVTHLQYLTKGAPETREVSAVLQGPYVYEEWEKLKALALEMKQTAEIEEHKDVEPCLSACGAYGGCPYQDICGVLQGAGPNPFENIGFVSTKEEKSMTEKNRLQQLLEKRRNDEMRKETGRAPEAEKETSALAAFSGIQKGKGISPSEMGIVPPDSPKAKEKKPAQKEGVLQARYQMAGEKLREMMETASIASLTQKEVGQAVADLFGMKRLRWNHIEGICATQKNLEPKESNRTIRLSTVEEKPSQAKPAEIRPPSLKKQEEKPFEQTPVQAVPVEKNGHSGITLYIDCFPMKGESPTMLEDLLAPYIKKVSESHDIPTPQMLDYAKGKAEVAALLCLNFPKSGEIVASSKSPYWANVEPYLVGAAIQVVRRFM